MMGRQGAAEGSVAGRGVACGKATLGMTSTVRRAGTLMTGPSPMVTLRGD